MAYLDRLKAELADDPLGRGYAGMTAEGAAADLNTVYRDVYRPTPAGDLRSVLLKSTQTDLTAIKAAAEDSQSPVYETAYRAWVLLNDREAVIDFRSAAERGAVASALQALVDAGALHADDRAAMLATGSETITRAAELGFGEVKVGHVEMARAK